MTKQAISFLFWQWVSCAILTVVAAFLKNNWLITLGCIGLIDYWLTIYAHK